MATETEVNEILAHPFDREWTIQGFGMLRTYLDDAEVHRLHIWDVDAAVPEVSVIHDHPWDFDSQIYRGFVTNQRYELGRGGERVRVGRIKTGEGGGLIGGKIERGRLHHIEPEYLGPGDSYHMDAPELHESIPSRGAVTVISRRFHTARDDQFATVCWRSGDWVSAEPRPATLAEVAHFVGLARTVA
jgi:hypothetical protein